MVIERRPPGRPRLPDDQKKPPRVRRDRLDPELKTITFVLPRALHARMKMWAFAHDMLLNKSIIAAMKFFLDAQNAPEPQLGTYEDDD